MPTLQQAYGQESNYSADGSEALFSALEGCNDNSAFIPNKVTHYLSTKTHF